MAKYTVQQKLDAIMLYKQGISSTRIANQTKINKHFILRWVEIFDTAGISGLTSYGNSLQHFDASFKLEVINWLVRTHSSYPQTARHFNLASPSVIWHWKQRYDIFGVAGLSDQRKRKEHQITEEQLTPEQEIKQLRERLEYAEAEVTYLKKLDDVMKQKRMKTRRKQ
ncbi:helix-turn-helix domain-containing protein [Weissella minor]|uniref:helix-turn-helix domain-containing protein n=1 Tax=Weissella minor TaxID=1620 RepID=UPI003AF2AA3D